MRAIDIGVQDAKGDVPVAREAAREIGREPLHASKWRASPRRRGSIRSTSSSTATRATTRSRSRAGAIPFNHGGTMDEQTSFLGKVRSLRTGLAALGLLACLSGGPRPRSPQGDSRTGRAVVATLELDQRMAARGGRAKEDPRRGHAGGPRRQARVRRHRRRARPRPAGADEAGRHLPHLLDEQADHLAWPR